jgi:hypothetical protein
MDDEDYRPAEEQAPGGELIAHELTHTAQQGEAAPAQEAPEDDRESFGDDVVHVVESAAELGLGAVIAPWTGGETVNIVGSVASMLEAGVDRLTHLGEHESVPEAGPPDTSIPDSEPGYGPDDGRE